ncbi:Transcriptional regulator, contains XRE-family HTH domain [Bradyrhizobium sp. Gha]|nr:Transcriptional regulator, contains XRE-family HTH domain [Bradyrhizobium sp. Gha]
MAGGKHDRKPIEGKRVRRGALSVMTRPAAKTNAPVDTHQYDSGKRNALALAVGKEIKSLRLSLNMAANQLAEAAGLSNAMLSRIEHGSATPSFTTLASLSAALRVPVSRLFAAHNQPTDYSLVRSGKGINVRRQAHRSGLSYQLLGHLLSGEKYIEPYLVTLTSDCSNNPGFQHTGIEFMYVLEGSMIYRYGDAVMELHHGDTLVFDANFVHGHEKLLTPTVRVLSVVFNLRT